MVANQSLAVVIPALNEGQSIGALVRSIVAQGVDCVVSDGGSRDETVALAIQAGAHIVSGQPGRSRQLNAGAQALIERPDKTAWLLFLHADVRLPPDMDQNWLQEQLRRTQVAGRRWARFDVELTASASQPAPRMLRTVAAMMNWRSAHTGICTGDQGLLVSTDLFEQIGGFAPIALMEDIDISKRLKQAGGWPARLPGPLLVSGRRWQSNGVWRTIMQMWWYRFQYFVGVSPERLHKAYYGRD